ncbi:MAG: transcriptional coactivator p15/PC4 family protein [Actinobacteria bacterium]|nr:transcriptional coactivator p15/PC4 family protein [Actinomycetota bacterium]MCG2817864.1 transcriptional coactivator p15/PC4 family protein [Actinomycetes bacterium]MBU4217750.1 transcriptional coactivator p15/PC4 family protein [Actinomycetota bacterium]MBU4358937.1 transcriptional coactivator p15/PC4 family protein [Actinomycetota bacterium]MBU4391722.1 transcriptional coactivator p15/PC4 family protein [Actinomycetota bacterium]
MSEGTVAENDVIGRFKKSNTADIQVSVVPWEGNNYLDIREVLPGPDGCTYTKKGIRFRADLAGDLVELLGQLTTESQETHGEAV